MTSKTDKYLARMAVVTLENQRRRSEPIHVENLQQLVTDVAVKAFSETLEEFFKNLSKVRIHYDQE